MKRVAPLAIALLFACSSSDPYDPESDRALPRPQMRQTVPVEAGTDVLPPPRWWREGRLAEPLKLSDQQVDQLNAIDAQEAADLQRLRREAMLAAREFENALDAEPPSTADIVAAGERLGTSRETLLDREVKRVAAERAVLTRDQWRRLQEQLHTPPPERYGRMYPRRPPIYPGWGPRGWPGWGWPWY